MPNVRKKEEDKLIDKRKKKQHTCFGFIISKLKSLQSNCLSKLSTETKSRRSLIPRKPKKKKNNNNNNKDLIIYDGEKSVLIELEEKS